MEASGFQTAVRPAFPLQLDQAAKVDVALAIGKVSQQMEVTSIAPAGGYVWFDPTTMAIPAPGKLGNCGISTERGPGLKQIDLSLSKSFRIAERGTVLFRFDAINAFNTPIFAVAGYATDVFPGGGIDKSQYGANAAYTASIPTGLVNSSVGARNLQFALKFSF
ncbi:MAG TPA: hypothetical protein VGL72_13725 [Bryobacteraceae bacterium]